MSRQDRQQNARCRELSSLTSPYARRLRLETLEDRRMLALVTVTTDQDVVDFNDGVTSLREAIFSTNLIAGADEIQFDFGHDGPATILLTHGELTISDSLTIAGSGAELLTIDASGSDMTPGNSDGKGSRIFNVDNLNGLADVNVTIGGLKLTGGDSNNEGGAIRSRENLSILNALIIANHSRNDGGGVDADGHLIVSNTTLTNNSAGDNGGAIRNKGTGQITSSIFSDNMAVRGGGIDNRGILVIDHSTLSNNMAERGGGINTRSASTTTINFSTFANNSGLTGGGINSDGVTTIYASLISSNSAGAGGGVYADGQTTITNSTIAHNMAFEGGGIRSRDTVTILQSTISGNSAENGGGIYAIATSNDPITISFSTIADNSATSFGGGVFVSGVSIFTQLDHTIVTGNSAALASPDIFGAIYWGEYHVVGIGKEFLGPLADNGGPTPTHALLPGSPAINAGNPSAVPGFNGVPEFDQRGEAFERVLGTRLDIGAVEQAGVPIIVDTLLDESDGDLSRFDVSLREAIELANEQGGPDIIQFDPILTAIAGPLPATILLTMGELVITDSVDIQGLGADQFTIDASGNDPTPNSTPLDDNSDDDGDGSRIFNIKAGINIEFLYDTIGRTPATAASSEENMVTISGLSLTGGDSLGGGAILSAAESLTLQDTSIYNNNASGGDGDGGGILLKLSSAKSVSIISTTIRENSSSRSGGGIYSSGHGQLTVSDSTISDNYAINNGGGIRATNTDIHIDSSRIKENTALNFDGGGINLKASSIGSLTINSSTVSGNFAGDDGGGIKFYGLGGSSSEAARLVLNSSSVSGNFAVSRGGGIEASGYAPVSLGFSTISRNSADLGGGFFSFRLGSLVQTSHTIIAGNTATNPSPDFYNLPPYTGASLYPLLFTSLIGNNAELGITEAPIGSPNSNGSLIGGPIHGVIDPLLGPLTNNGGPTQTHALLPGSPAINAGDPTLQQGHPGLPEFDQRGAPFGRVASGRIDIGAYEAQVPPSADFDSDGDVDGRDFLAWQRGFGTAIAARADGNSDDDMDVDGSDLAAWQVSFGQPQVLLPPVVEPSGTELLDIALASVWLDTEAEEEMSFFESESFTEASIDDVRSLRAIAPGVFKATDLDLRSELTNEGRSSSEPWLSNEMLERVFG